MLMYDEAFMRYLESTVSERLKWILNKMYAVRYEGLKSDKQVYFRVGTKHGVGHGLSVINLLKQW